MAAPGGKGFLCIVVTGEIVLGYFRVDACKLIASVFLIKSIGIVFGMSCEENLAPLSGGDGINARLIRGSENTKIPHCLNIGSVYRSVARVRNVENVIKATEENGSLVINYVRINTGKLFLERSLIDTIMVVESCLRAPANMKGGMNVSL